VSTLDATVTGSTPLPCDVTAVLQSHCQGCHGATTTNAAPMSLVTWEELHAPVLPDQYSPDATPGEEVYQMVESRIHDTRNPMPPPPNAALSASDLATLDSWIAAGAPKTDGVTCTASDDGGPGVPDASPPTLDCAQNTTVLAPASAWSMPQNEDDQYVCYSYTVSDLAAGATGHVVGMTPNIDNHSIVHHVLLFQADPADTTVTTTPAPCGAGGSLTWRIVYGWAPGGGALQTPPDVGFPYTNGTQFIVQVHYNNIKGLSGQTDSSGFSFCTTDQPVKYDADVVAFGSMSFNIPQNSTLNWTCPYTLGSVFEGLQVFAAFPHMHQLGLGIETEQQLAGGGIVDMGKNSPWNFQSQIWFPLATTLHQGDVVTTQCSWQNNTGASVGFGQNTEDEMCYSFTAYYPKANFATWAQPAAGTAGNCYAADAGGLPTPDAGWVSVGDSGAVYTPIDAGTSPSDASGD